MKLTWKTVYEMLFLIHEFQIQIPLTKDRIHTRVERFVWEHEDDYDGWLEDDGFIVKEKIIKSLVFGWKKNTQAPLAKAKIVEENDSSTVSVVIRSNETHRIMMLILEAMMFECMFFELKAIPVFLFLKLLDYLSLFRPAKRLKKHLIAILTKDT